MLGSLAIVVFVAVAQTDGTAPVLSSVTPSVGRTLGQQPVTLDGMNFQIGARVAFGGVAATNVVVVSPMRITANTPQHRPGLVEVVDVTVTNPDGQVGTLPRGFTYLDAPSLGSCFPASGTIDGSRVVTLSGSSFMEGATVVFGGVSVPATIVDSFNIRITTPGPMPPGPVDITVTNPDGRTSTRPNLYTYTSWTIVGLSPRVASIRGGARFTISMRNGPPGCPGCIVFFGAAPPDLTAVTELEAPDDNTITGMIPAHLPGDVNVIVGQPGVRGDADPNFAFHVPPSVISLDVSSGPSTGGTRVNISGAGFVPQTQVHFGTVASPFVTVLSPTSLTAETPPRPDEPGTVSVTATNPDGLSGTLVNAFTFGSAPRVDSVEPGSGPVGGGTLVTIRGVNFQPGSRAQFGDRRSDATSFVDANTLTALSPANVFGFVGVSVTNPDGQSHLLPAAFNYGGGPPILLSLSPSSGALAGGTQVTLGGSNFSSDATVTFGGVPATNLNRSSATITATTPPHTAGAVDVVVTNSDSQSATLPAAYTYRSGLAPPVDDYLDPASVRPKGCSGAGSSPGALSLVVLWVVLGRRRRWNVAARLLSILLCLSGCKDFSTQRNLPARPSLGEQLYGVFCDRLGAQSLREDLTGSSYHLLCHRKDDRFADQVDRRFLPPLAEAPTDRQLQIRSHGIARIEALARRRSDLIAALDAMLPDILVAGKELKNPVEARTCDPAGQEKFRDQLSDLLHRLQADNLYIDGTLPNSTQALGSVFSAWKTDTALQSALARLDAHQGYHPAETSMGAIGAAVSYPGLRDVTNSALSLLSPDSKPYDPQAQHDPSGQRIPVPGSAYAQLSKLIEVGHHELRTATPDELGPPLSVVVDPALGREVLNRPRTTAETLQRLLLVEDPLLGGGDPKFIVRRDQRGVADVRSVDGSIPFPFVDQDGDGLADTDELGRFLTRNGAPAPTPFGVSSQPLGVSRDMFGRAISADGLFYNYVDVNHTFVGALFDDLKPLVNPDPSQSHETLMDALGGVQPLLGSRRTTTKDYGADAREGPATVSYAQFDPASSVALDLAWAGGQMLGDPTIDDTLALTRKLFAEHPNDMARLVSALLDAKEIANRPEYAQLTLSGRSIFWDELIDVAINIARADAVPGRPSLLEDLLTALGTDDARPFKDVIANQMTFKDLVSYDRGNLNGPPLSYSPGSSGGVDLATGRAFGRWWIPVDRSQPDTGSNRSFFQRYLQLIHESHGVAVCNAKDGRLFLHNICDPVFGCGDLAYPSAGLPGADECKIYRIRDLAIFYFDSIVGEAKLYLRPQIGLFTQTTPAMFAASTGLTSWWPTPRAADLRPKPEFLNRLVFFDFTDSPDPGDLNYRTNCFVSAVNGPFFVPPDSTGNRCTHVVPPPPYPVPYPDGTPFLGGVGTAVCAPRTIRDPFADDCTSGRACPTDADGPDYLIPNLRSCESGQWLAERDNNVLFAFEQPILFPDGATSSTYRALVPVVSAFVLHRQEELFMQLIEVLHRHWQDDRGTADECRPNDRNSPYYCSQDGLVRFELMLAEIFQGDLLDALNNVNKILTRTTIQHCNRVDSRTKVCTSSTPMNGITVMARAARALIDPQLNPGLTDRLGRTTTRWNDGTTTVPVTPLYLLIDALNAADRVFDGNPDRKAMWRRARSQLVDQFLGVVKNGRDYRFARPGLPKVAITAMDAIRAQLLAKCPGTFNPPYSGRCGWARDEIYSNVRDTLSGPLFAAVQDLTEALRADTDARRETEKFLTYLLGAPVNSPNRTALLGSIADLVQLAGDQADFIPILHALAPAVSLSTTDGGGVRQAGLPDSQLRLLTRAAGKAFNSSSEEICSKEVDPNQVITEVLKRATIPVSINGSLPQTPLEVYLDVIADVNRAAPERTDKLKPEDYASIFNEVTDFMLSPEHGLEQFYEIVRQGTVR